MRKSRTELGDAVERALGRAGRHQQQLADDLGQSASYVSQVLRGKKRPSAQWVDLIADTLNLNDKQRHELHLKAARQLGFKL